MARPLAVTIVAAMVIASLASARANDPKKMYVQAPQATIYAWPDERHPVVIRVDRGREVVELKRIGPGLHRIFRQDFTDAEVEIPQGGGWWAYVHVDGTGGKSGWVRADDIGPGMPSDIKKAKEEAEFTALMTAIDQLGRSPCSSELYFTRLVGAWYVKAPGTSAIEVERWLGRTDYSYRLLKLVDRLGGGRHVPMVTVLRATGEC